MAHSYDAPIEVRELEKMLNNFTYRNGFEVSRVFDDFLEYVIWGFSPWGKPIENWRYNQEQNKFFFDMLKEWIMVMNKQVPEGECWYDAFGDLYMACVASKSRQQGNAQFFTPPEICDLMVMLESTGEKPTGKYCGDPTCGSGRTLLAWHVRNPGNYICGEDIDRTCCLMSVCNFLIHACVGEVIWHNSLDPGSFYKGWKVNEILSKSGIPTIREIEKEESFVWNHWETRRLRAEAEQLEKPAIQKPEIVASPTKKKKQGNQLQLNFFDELNF